MWCFPLQGDASGAGDVRAGPPTRKRRLDFTNISEGSPSLAFATAGDSPYTSKLDMLAAAASEAAGQAPTPVTSNASHELRQSGPSSAAGGPPLQPSPTVDRENAPPTRTPRRATLAAAAAAANAREGSLDDMDAVNSPGCDVLAAAAARGKREMPASGVCHDFAIDLQNRAGDGRGAKGYPEAKPDMLGRSHHPTGASNVRSSRCSRWCHVGMGGPTRYRVCALGCTCTSCSYPGRAGRCSRHACARRVACIEACGGDTARGALCAARPHVACGSAWQSALKWTPPHGACIRSGVVQWLQSGADRVAAAASG